LPSRWTILAVALLLVGFSVRAQEQNWNVEHQPATIVNGSPVLFRVTVPEHLSSLQGRWLEHEVAFREEAKCDCWYAIAGVPLDTHAAQYPLELEGTTASGSKLKYSYKVTSVVAQYPSTAIKVAPQYVEPPKETLTRIEEEQALKKKSFSQTSPDSLWKGAFDPPAQAEISGVFGSARVFNGVKRNQHTGIDFRVHTGTPIRAANSGTVVLARNLYFEGNCVAVDHGQGLITLYLHLSEFKVKEGDRVERGQLLGLSGGTGRATAPHLHFAVRWQGAYLNPATLLKLTPP
jgi:murein DD-endopeptidase MepM/ murein hydrolase activator NlpD